MKAEAEAEAEAEAAPVGRREAREQPVEIAQGCERA